MTAFLVMTVAAAITAAFVILALVRHRNRPIGSFRLWRARGSTRNPGAFAEADARVLLRDLLGRSLRAEEIDIDTWIPFSGNTSLLRTSYELLVERTLGNVVAGGDRLAALIQQPEVPPVEAASLMDVICTSALGGTPLAGHVEMALVWADAGLARKPDHWPLQATRAGLLVLNGQASDGVPLLESFFPVAPPDQRGWIAGLLALGLHKLGRAREAEAWWSEADAALAAEPEAIHRAEFAEALDRWRMLAASPE